MTAGTLYADDALLPDGWARGVRLAWDDAGRLREVAHDGECPPGTPRAPGPVLPGMPNLHSHAFQRGFAGLAEHRSGDNDTFWSWREVMYHFASRVTPAQLEALATWLFVEMLESGYTSVCEFHYLHHDPDGAAYADETTMAACILRAAERTGLGLTLLPVLYQAGGFDGRPVSGAQRRFVHSPDSLLALIDRLAPLCQAQHARLGIAFHSLRAVPAESLHAALDGLEAIAPDAPVHIHVAEQSREVDDCLDATGQRPVEWLLEHTPIDARWCLVHATHLTADERRRAARQGAVAGLCPTTEANLGDGLFDLPAWSGAGGRWGVGSDSHVTVDAAEELRLLEYGQRLRLEQRNVAARDDQPHTAAALMLAAVAGGTQAAGHGGPAGLAPGARADLVVLDAASPLLAGLPPDAMLAAHVFASHRRAAIAEVWTSGIRRVAAGRHPIHDDAAAAFVAARAALAASGVIP